MMNVPTDAQGLERLLRWCDPSNTMQRRLGDCHQRATRCRQLNERNGALVTARLKKVEGMLDVLTGRANQPKVYGRQGMFQQPKANARVLASV
jgi:flagellar biosynthesis protein FlgN